MQTDAFGRLKFELCEYLRLYDMGLKAGKRVSKGHRW